MNFSGHLLAFSRSATYTAVLVLLLLAPQAHAQGVDSDGDGVENALEISGFRFDLLTGQPVACTPGVDEKCYVTDPLSWSSDGDPYSDFQEASGVNMDATVRVPYNSPLVAAYPVIEVVLHQYTFTSNATITDTDGRTLSSGESFTSSVSTTTTTTVSAEVGASAKDGLNASVSGSYSYSKTKGYASQTTSGEELNWETATSTKLDDAGTLSLSVFARNSGGATALNVRPTFNVYIGDDLVATVLPDVPFRQSLAPGEQSAPVVPVVNTTPLAVTLSFSRLVALQRGAPVTIEVVDILADIQRWRPQDSNWECGTGETCSWTSFQNQILPRTLRLLVDFGYSGDPDADIPFQFRGNPYEYRVFTGSPSTSPQFTLRDVLGIAGFSLNEAEGNVAIEGRGYPSGWVLVEEPDAGGFTPIFESWNDAGQPSSLLGVVMPRQATLFMTSPDPDDPGAAIRSATFTPDLRHLRVQALPRAGLPIASAEAHVFVEGIEQVVPLVLANGGAYWTSEGSSVPIDGPMGAASSYVVFTDVVGNTQRRSLSLPITQAATCADVPEDELRNVQGGGGNAILFPSGRLDIPVEAYCTIGSEETSFWAPLSPGPNESFGTITRAGERSLLSISDKAVLRSEDRGRTWTRISDGAPLRVSAAHRPGSGTVVGIGRVSEQSGRITRSTDGGVTWSSPASFPVLSGVLHAYGTTWFVWGGRGFIASPQVRRSTDDGRTWSTITFPSRMGGPVGLVFRDASVALLTESDYDRSESRIWRTLDGGQTWAVVFSLGDRGMGSVAYAGDDTWYATASPVLNRLEPTLYRSTQNGAPGSWETIPLASLGVEWVAAPLFVSPDTGFVASSEGLLRTEDGGRTFTFDPSPLSLTPIIAFDENTLLASGGPTGYALTSSGGTGMPNTAVAVAPGDGIAEVNAMRLEPNRPNPFGPRTTITYVLDADAEVSLAVYDLMGREVARLAEGPRPAGTHDVPIDAEGWAAGVYVVRLQAGAQTATRLVTHLR